jgi:CBS domain containing-hemolysin-like protein
MPRTAATRPPLAAGFAALLGSGPACASFLAGDTLDKAADVLAWIVLVFVPVVVIAVFWMVHVLPEKIAAKRHHPQKDAIHVLCLLSLVFGGLLWPLAWLWAYTRPVLHQMAYGRDRHDSFYESTGAAAETGSAGTGRAQPSAAALRAEIAALSSKLAELEAGGPPSAGGLA